MRCSIMIMFLLTACLARLPGLAFASYAFANAARALGSSVSRISASTGLISATVLTLAGGLASADAVHAQIAQVAQVSTRHSTDQGPHFLLASRTGPLPIDVDRTPILQRRLSLDLNGATLKEALAEISAQAGLRLTYSDDVVPLGKRVRLRAEAITVLAALTDVLLGAGVDVVFNGGSRAALVRRVVAPPEPAVGSIVGRVTDGETGQPVSGAQVVVVGTGYGALSGDDGRYAIQSVPSGEHEVRVQRLGYAWQSQTVSVPATGRVTVNFALVSEPTRLQELIVTATGEQRRVEIGNVIGRIEADSLIAAAPVTSFSDLLNARVPGTQIILHDGMSGSSPDIRIRGVNSFSVSSAPLIIVDGIRVNNESTGTNPLGGIEPRAMFGDWGGRLNDLNPEEIESIEIVKGPSAATLYGTDAANGVVVITTKRGQPGPPSWTAYAEAGILEPAVSFLDNYHSWGHDATGRIRQCPLIDAATGVCSIDSLTTFNPLENPRTSPIGTGFRHQLGAQVRGGADRFTYFISAEHERETGYLELPEAERGRLMAERGTTSIPDEQIRPNWAEKLSLRANTGVSFGSAELTLSNGLVLGNKQIPRSSLLITDGNFGQGYDNPATYGGWYNGDRPGEFFSTRNTERFSRYIGSLSGSWRPTSWFSTRAVLGLDLANVYVDALIPHGEGTSSQGSRGNTRSTTALYSVDVGASALFSLRPDLSSRTSVGFQFNESSDQVTSVRGRDLPPGSETLAGAATITGMEMNNQTIVAGAYLEQQFGLDDRLFITGAARFDGGSSFGQDFRTAVYPKASASWLAVDEEPNRWLNSLRLRAAYGASGVQPGATAALTLYDVFTAYVNGANTAASRPSTVGNSELKPERQAEVEVGADATFYHGRISVEATYYNRLSKDALIERPLSPDVGVSSRWENIGSVRNSGIEGSIFAQIIETSPFSWDISLNGSINHNKLEELGLDVPFLGSSPASQHREGYPLYGRWAVPILSYDDANGNGIIEPDEVTYGDEEVFFGTSTPRHQLTVSSGVSLFDNLLRVSSLFDYRGGFAQANLKEISRCRPVIGNCRAVNDPNAPLWEQARAVAVVYGGSGGLLGTWAGFFEDGSFTRWRELSLSLNLPRDLVGVFGARSAILTLTGRNLAQFTDYTGTDPEITAAPRDPAVEGYLDSNSPGPQPRYWILRLTLGL